MPLLSSRRILVIFALPAAVNILLLIIGGMFNYSPVPHWDMWQGLVFIAKLQQGDYSEWWDQHNEHRILLTRALFWLDHACCQGYGYLLHMVNYLLLLLINLVLYRYLQERLPTTSSEVKAIFALVMLTGGVSWIQQENLNWTFQSQFFLAQLLPLWAFFCLHQAHVAQEHSERYFVLASLSGVAALGSMANGVLVLPLLVLFAALLGMQWQRIGSLIFLTVCGCILYFYDYHSPSGHGALTAVLLHQTGAYIQYILLYLGGPFYYLFGSQSILLAQMMGVLLIVSAFVFARSSLRHPKQSSLTLALLLYLLYIGGTALATAGGRVVYGLQQALSSRYMTPTLIVWSVMFILLAPKLSEHLKRYPILILSALFGVQCLFVVQQLPALETQKLPLFDKMISALAVEMNIQDKQQITKVYPSEKVLLIIEKQAVAQHVGIFNYPGIKNAGKLIGQSFGAKMQQACVGSIDSYQRLEDPRFVQFSGWLFDQEHAQTPAQVYVVNDAGIIVGYALTGMQRYDLLGPIHAKAQFSGFKGYVLTEYVGKNLQLSGQNPDCQLQTAMRLSPEDELEAELEVLGLGLGIRLDNPILAAADNIAHLTELQQFNSVLGDKLENFTADTQCVLNLHQYFDLPNDARFVRVRGEMECPKSMHHEVLHLTDSSGKVVGFGLAAMSNAHHAQPPVEVNYHGRFSGYLASAQLGQPLVLSAKQNKITATAVINHLPFKINKLSSIHLQNLATNEQIIGNNQWLGKDVQNTQLEGYRVWGSHITADSDVGSITLQLQRGNSVFYRSGPTGGKQKLIISTQPATHILPVAEDWVELQFADAKLPTSFTVTLIDDGNEWGEWSAIGLSNVPFLE